MKLLQSILLSLLAISCGTYSSEAAKAKDLQTAYEKAKDNPIMVYCYAANFNEASEDHYKEFMKRRKLTRGISSLLYVELPVYQNPDKSEAKKQASELGNVGMPSGMWTLPCVLILDKDKNLRGSIRDWETLSDVEKSNEKLKELITTYKKQQNMLNSCERTKSSRKAEIIAEAADLGEAVGLSVPASYGAAAAAVAKDGYGARFTFNWENLLPELDKLEDHTAATNYIKGMMNAGKYSKKQQQELLCALTGHLRRGGAKAAKLKELYTEMYKIDPKSVYGSYAEECIRTYCTEE